MKKKTLQKISRLFASLVLVGAMSLGTVCRRGFFAAFLARRAAVFIDKAAACYYNE